VREFSSSVFQPFAAETFASILIAPRTHVLGALVNPEGPKFEAEGQEQ